MLLLCAYVSFKATIEADISTMNPEDIVVVTAPVLAKGALALGASVPFTAIAKRMLGPAADEIAEMMRDQVRLYRYGRQLACVQKAAKMAEDAGFTPHEVPSKLLFPLLEGASFEENEDLHTMWAALLANASSPKWSDGVRPGYIALLRQMASDEAALLNWLYTDALRQKEPSYCLTIEWYVPDLRSPYRRLVDAIGCYEWDAALPFARTGQHSEASADPRRRIQYQSHPAEDVGCGDAAGAEKPGCKLCFAPF
jgi:hypothetical protein